MHPKHDEDFYSWTIATALLLKQRKFDEVDMDSVIEELESMSASEKRALVSCLAQLMLHLLKWQYQPTYRGASWNISINKQRVLLEDILAFSPGLKQFLPELQARAYKHSVLEAMSQTGLDKKIFSNECPYTFEQLLNVEFLPS